MKNLEFKKLIEENLESIEDIELVLLKGHLVIEQLLTELLELNMENPGRLKSINPMFAKKLEIYLAFEGNSIISEGLEKVLKDLNNVRNKLAHNLNHPDFNERLLSWVQHVSRENIKNTKDREILKKQLIAAVSNIAAFLSGAIQAKKHITQK